MVIRDGMALVGLGTLLGLLGALLTSRLVAGLLFGVAAIDPLTYLSVPMLLALVAWVACWVPALRASRVDPVVALREE